ncbi:MAG: prepilin-type N-terminal cleavage/methylation domain-containing protein [Candidatus Eremiobacteraeota bacterium]|nr:prepilin-type N-terminal cleavage/methylation domain-containing protein [Candidatus Eremiobacteraeota bacterium]
MAPPAACMKRKSMISEPGEFPGTPSNTAMCTNQTTKRSRGFTLAEIMVCLLLLTIAVMGLVSTQIYSLKATGGNKYRHLASVIAYRVMSEKEKALRTDFSVSAAHSRSDVPGEEGFQYEVLEEAPGTSIKKVTVKVYWTEGTELKSYSLWTYLYDY